MAIIFLITLLVGATISTLCNVYLSYPDRGFATATSIIVTVLLLTVVGISWKIGSGHEHQRKYVEAVFAKQYPEMQFTRVGVQDQYIEFHPKDNPTLKCNGLILRVTGHWYISHGSIDCSDIGDTKSNLLDKDSEALDAEVRAITEYTKAQNNPAWFVTSR